MIKALKIGGICLGCFLLLALVGIGILMQPNVQKNIVLNSLKKKYSTISLSSLQVDLESMVFENLEWDEPNFSLDIERLEVRTDILQLYLRKSLLFEKIDASGVQLHIKDLRKGVPRTDLDGRTLRKLLSFDQQFGVGTLNINGKILTPVGNIEGNLSGHQLSFGRINPISWTGKGKLLGQSFTSIGTLEAEYDFDGGIELLKSNITYDLANNTNLIADLKIQISEEAEIFKGSLSMQTESNSTNALEILKVQGTNFAKLDRLEIAVNSEVSFDVIAPFHFPHKARIPQDLYSKLDFQGIRDRGTWSIDRGIFDTVLAKCKAKGELIQSCRLDMDKGTFTGLPLGSKVVELETTIPSELLIKSDRFEGETLVAKWNLINRLSGFELKPEQQLIWEGVYHVNGTEESSPRKMSIQAFPTFRKTKESHTFELRDLKVKYGEYSVLSGNWLFENEQLLNPWQWQSEFHTEVYPLEQLFRKSKSNQTFFFKPKERAFVKASGTYGESKLSIKNGTMEIADKWSTPWFKAAIVKELSFKQNGKLVWDTSHKGQLLEIDMREMEWERLGAIIPDLELNLSPTNSNWALTVDDEHGIQIGTSYPLKLENLTVAWKNKTYLQRTEAQGMVNLILAKDWSVNCKDIFIGQRNLPIATGNFSYKKNADQTPEWDCELKLDLNQASRSPLFKANEPEIEKGTCTIKLKNLSESNETDLAMLIRDTQLKEMPGVVLNIDVNAETLNGKRVEVSFETPAGNERISKGSFKATDKKLFELTAESLYQRDLMMLAELSSKWQLNGTKKHSSNVDGEFRFVGKFEKFYLLSDVPMEDMTFHLKADLDSIEIDNFTAKIGEGSIDGFLEYQSPRGLESTLKGSLQTKSVPLEHFLPKPEKGKSKAYSGIMDLNMTVNGSGGKDINQMLEVTEVTLSAKIKKGHYFFKELDDKFDALTKLAGNIQKVGESVGGIPFADKLVSTTQKATSLVGIGGDLMEGILKIPGVREKLTKIDYDYLNLDAQRTPIGRTKIQKFELRGPNASIDGSGEIGSVPILNIRNGPLNLDMTLGTKGVLETFFAKIGQLDTEYNLDGYRLFKANPLRITGTLNKPRLDDLWSIIFPGGSEEPENTAPKVYDPETTPGLHPQKSPLQQAIDSILPF